MNGKNMVVEGDGSITPGYNPEEYKGMASRGKGEPYPLYLLRRKQEKVEAKTKAKGTFKHVSKYVTANKAKDLANPDNKHYNIDGDGTYVAPK